LALVGLILAVDDGAVMTKILPALCILLGITSLGLISALMEAHTESNRWSDAYSSVLHEEDSLRQSLAEAQQREIAPNDKISDLQGQLTRCNKALDIAEARLQQKDDGTAPSVPSNSSENQDSAQNYTITDRSGNVYNVS
jgi:hypothetical protein